MERKKHTVGELIEKLNAVEDKSLFVELDGCDCTDYWNGELVFPVAGSRYEEQGAILIQRHNGSL